MESTMPVKPPPVGANREQELETSPGMGVTHVGPVETLSTPSMIGFMERVSLQLLQEYLDENERSVGARVNVRHLAPSAVGQSVRVKSTYVGMEGRRSIFEVEAYCGEIKIGDGTHERAVVDPSRFQSK